MRFYGVFELRNFSYQKNNSFVDFVSNKNTFVAPSLTWRPSTRFEFNLEFEYQRKEFVHFGGGVPAIGNRPADIPRSRYIGDPNISVANPNQQNRDFIGFDWTYAFNDNWNLKHRFGYTDVDYLHYYASANAMNETTGILTQKLMRSFMTRASYATNLDLTGKFSTGDIRHQVLLGIDYYRLTQPGSGNMGNGPALQPINIFNPVYNGVGLSSFPRSTYDNWFFLRKENWTGITAAILGGYALATLFSIALAGLPAVHRADSVLAALLLSFVVYTAAILWAFTARSAWFAWLGLLVPAVLSGVLIWLVR